MRRGFEISPSMPCRWAAAAQPEHPSPSPPPSLPPPPGGGAARTRPRRAARGAAPPCRASGAGFSAGTTLAVKDRRVGAGPGPIRAKAGRASAFTSRGGSRLVTVPGLACVRRRRTWPPPLPGSERAARLTTYDYYSCPLLHIANHRTGRCGLVKHWILIPAALDWGGGAAAGNVDPFTLFIRPATHRGVTKLICPHHEGAAPREMWIRLRCVRMLRIISAKYAV